MSPTNTRRSTDSAALGHPAGRPIPQTPGGGNTSVLDHALLEAVRVKGPYPPRPVAPARLDPRREASACRWVDPSNYLG